MAVKELSLSNFRAVSSDSLKAISPVTGIWGPNGSGKSTVLQALVALKNLNRVGYGPDALPALNQGGLSFGTWETTFFRGRQPGKALSIEAKGETGDRLAAFILTDTEVTLEQPSAGFSESVRYFPPSRTLTSRSAALGPSVAEGLALTPNTVHSYLHWFLHEKIYERQQTGKPNEIDEINGWMKAFGLGSLSDKSLGGPKTNVTGMFKDAVTGYAAPIADGGFGGISMLPVLLEGLSCRNAILLVEEPEMSLHPGAQASLFDLFLDFASNRGHQVIFTSHSEYLLRRLARYFKENPGSATVGGYVAKKDANGAHFSTLDKAYVVDRWENKHLDILPDLHAHS